MSIFTRNLPDNSPKKENTEDLEDVRESSRRNPSNSVFSGKFERPVAVQEPKKEIEEADSVENNEVHTKENTESTEIVGYSEYISDLEELRETVPANLKAHVTQDLLDRLNNAINEPEMLKNIQDNFITFSDVLSQGKFKVTDYVDAVRYVSFKLLGDSNTNAYEKTFPDRVKRILSSGGTASKVSAYASMYNKGILVNKIMEQALVPTWVLNAPVYQEAINTQAEIMRDPNISAHARTMAANSILTHLAKPKEAAQLNIDYSNSTMDNLIDRLADTLQQVGNHQKSNIIRGVPVQDVIQDNMIKTTFRKMEEENYE